MIDWIADPNAWIALATLTALEIVLGIDNIIFLSVLVSRLPPARRNVARRLGLALAMITRIVLLLSLTWMMRLTEPLFTLWQEISGRDLILIGGGLFLLWKSVHEIHNSLEGEGDDGQPAPKAAGSAHTQPLLGDLDCNSAFPRSRPSCRRDGELNVERPQANPPPGGCRGRTTLTSTEPRHTLGPRGKATTPKFRQSANQPPGPLNPPRSHTVTTAGLTNC